jgi:hypothetical protein
MAKKIMVIRHAEKHDDAGVFAGVTIEGRPDPEDLTAADGSVPEHSSDYSYRPMARSSIGILPLQARFSRRE